jgi:NDP-4-keto-2,6-dideoxyhexose 3-C-methyltransferase
MKTRTTCRVCEGPLDFVLSLGNHFVSNFPAPDEDDGIKAPLELMTCRHCTLVQLRHTVPPASMYQNYWYRSGTNQSMRDALADITHKAEQLVHLEPGDAVLDIGCNDGTLLGSYRTPDLLRIGFDPAQNLAQYSKEIATTLVSTFFERDTYRQEPALEGVRPRIVTSIAMFYDLEEPNRFVADIKAIMDPNGVWVVQMSYLPLMLKQNAFDNICHEHLEYYSLASMDSLLSRHGMRVVDVEVNDVNGGSFRLYIRNDDAKGDAFADATHRALAAERVNMLRESELAIGLDSTLPYEDFAFRVERIKKDVVEFVQRETRAGKQVFVYGASTKGNTLLQYFGLDKTLIGAAAERNPDKWGKVTVGTRIPIISEAEARAKKPSYFLMLPWHFIDEFQRRERDYLREGGRFVVPMPHFSLL